MWYQKVSFSLWEVSGTIVQIGDFFEVLIMVCKQRLKEDIALYTKYVDLIETANKNIQRNANFDLVFDSMILDICFKIEGGR